MIIEEDDIFCDGVNVAARLQEVAGRGGFNHSGTVFEQIDGKVDLDFDDMGNQQLKNITKPIRVYRVRLSDISSTAGQRPFFDMSSEQAEPITGGCSCGAVRYEISAPLIDAGICHCRMCQRFTGSVVAPFASFPAKSVRFTQGEPKYFNSSPLAVLDATLIRIDGQFLGRGKHESPSSRALKKEPVSVALAPLPS